MDSTGFFKTILYKKMGWTRDVDYDVPEKCIICLAPHTSNWDFIMALLYRKAEGFGSNFLMKSDWFFWPLGPIFRHIGGIPVYREKHHGNMTEQLAEEARKRKKFVLTITPEGTRSYTEHWKRGFYYIALEAEIPIMLYALDYKKKLISCKRVFWPTGNVEEDMREIKEYYRGVSGRYPEKSSTSPNPIPNLPQQAGPSQGGGRGAPQPQRGRK